MELYIMNTALQTVGVVDVYKSIRWTKRYFTNGEFELVMPVEYLDIMMPENYIYRDDDDAIMVIEKILITTNAESGNSLTVSGRSVESLLARRIVWSLTTFSGTVENLIRKLITENAISPTNSARAIPNLVLGELQGFPEKIDTQITGDNLLTAIEGLCMSYGYGFRITAKNGQFVFDLYKGIDRSYNQTENPHVVFSPEFDNLITSTYLHDTSSLKTVALVAGEGEGNERKTATAGTASGLNRRELYVDARNVSSNAETPLTDAEYAMLLTENGHVALSENAITTGFDGEVEPENTNYQYKTDWNIGDIVQTENEYGIQAAPRIIEITENEDVSGRKIIPTFTTTEQISPPVYVLVDSAGYVLRDSTGAVLTVEV